MLAVNAWATTFVFLIPFTIASFALMFGNWSQVGRTVMSCRISYRYFLPFNGIFSRVAAYFHRPEQPTEQLRAVVQLVRCASTTNAANTEAHLQSLKASKPQSLKVSGHVRDPSCLRSMNHFENQKTFNDGYHIIHHCKPGLHWTQMPDEVRFHCSSASLPPSPHPLLSASILPRLLSALLLLCLLVLCPAFLSFCLPSAVCPTLSVYPVLLAYGGFSGGALPSCLLSVSVRFSRS